LVFHARRRIAETQLSRRRDDHFCSQSFEEIDTVVVAKKQSAGADVFQRANARR
jgi:hypothetical protein